MTDPVSELRRFVGPEVVRLHGDGELSLSAGTELVSEGYLPRAKVPREPWTPVDRASAPDLFVGPSEPWDQARHVALIQLPSEIMTTVRRLGLDKLPQQMVELQMSSAVARTMLENALRPLGHFHDPGTAPKAIGWSVQIARTPTMTVDLDTGDKTGLHVDSWDRLPLAERSSSRNRLCMNLGFIPRYFVFINLTLRGIWEILERPDANAGFRLGHLFMEKYPDYPVTRLIVNPGCAYIAPTENMLHDGMPGAGGALDMKYTMLGRFRPAASPSA